MTNNRPTPNLKNRVAAKHNRSVTAKRSRHSVRGKRARGSVDQPFSSSGPPEIWYEPSENPGKDYQFVLQSPGKGYRHVLTREEIRGRLAELPSEMLEPLEVIQLSRQTQKKQSFPCYGMQWGNAIYLYPMEDSLEEYFDRPPNPAEQIEARMYGARWVQDDPQNWRLIWAERAIRDFYLNNVLIHELGHLLDLRNNSTIDRERFAEWFAIYHGYKPSRRAMLAKMAVKKIVRRHHSRQ